MTAPTDSQILFTVPLPDAAATVAFATTLAPCLRPGDVLALWGDLGAGKSTLARALIQRLSHDPEDVPSPTFTLVQTYAGAVLGGDVELWHFDLYRLTHPEQAYDLAIEEAFQEGISLIEWPDRLGSLLPGSRLDLRLETAGTGRRLDIEGGKNWLSRLSQLQLGLPS